MKKKKKLLKKTPKTGEGSKKDMAEDEKKQVEEGMKAMKSSITGVFPFGVPGKAEPSPSSSPASK